MASSQQVKKYEGITGLISLIEEHGDIDQKNVLVYFDGSPYFPDEDVVINAEEALAEWLIDAVKDFLLCKNDSDFSFSSDLDRPYVIMLENAPRVTFYYRTNNETKTQ